MPPKGGNAKKESGRAKKAENEEKKKEAAAAAKEAKEANEWADGSKSGKSSKEEKEEKRRQEAAKKAERERLLAEEEASIASAKPKAAPKAGAKKGAASASGASSSKKAKEKEVPAGPGAIAAGGGLGGQSAACSIADDEHKLVESFAATGIDDALDLLTVINAKADKASVGQAAAGLERHPERRFKAAFEAYQERELPIIKKDHPGLRLNQYKDLLFKQFQKSPDNPFNQVVVDYNASKEDKVSALKGQRDTVAERLRQE
ncbi:DUF1014-domain-containing protein [Sistotremastrum niveocremeum HHB9708]|uniref:DUF1014-domain-containing protein n=1 Tax=Sistotremastrum niveocremeum HHB9708 TaxID=1314777 RepID=A0A165ABI9_9AGAM|nr:DUF1014-domain-containing protein [Sistotremastrum niveocremeum HHB9708]